MICFYRSLYGYVVMSFIFFLIKGSKKMCINGMSKVETLTFLTSYNSYKKSRVILFFIYLIIFKSIDIKTNNACVYLYFLFRSITK